MCGLGCEVMKIDFNYKLTKHVRVCTGRGRRFRLCKCMCTVQNEDTLTVWWGGMCGSESIWTLKPRLEGVKARLDRLGETVKVVCVDNCCNVKQLLQSVFPDALTKLDPFQWLK